MLDPQHLRSFQEIARTRSYSSAARRLGYTQPALSYQMRVLERSVGAPLTARAGRVVRLTPAGQALLRHADQILTAIRVAERDLAHVVGSLAGVLRVAAFDSAGATLVPAALARVTAAHPAVDARLAQANPSEATALVVRGDIDVAITYRYEALDDAPVAAPPVRSPLASIPLLTDHVHLVLPEQHPLAHTAPTGLWPLADESWLVGSDLFVDLLQRAAARAGFAARIANVADDAMSMQALVAQGVGVALLPGLALVAYQRPDLVAHPLPGWPARRGRGGDVARPAARAVGGGDGGGARGRRPPRRWRPRPAASWPRRPAVGGTAPASCRRPRKTGAIGGRPGTTCRRRRCR